MDFLVFPDRSFPDRSWPLWCWPGGTISLALPETLAPVSWGSTEVHKDDNYLATGTHDRGVSTTLHVKSADFKSYGISVGIYIENETRGLASIIATVTEEEITTRDEIAWVRGDTYKIYITNIKGSVISTEWVDLSRGWKTPRRDLIRGWREDDIDFDRDSHKGVFAPGQPKGDHT